MENRIKHFVTPLENLSKDLSLAYGKGLGLSNIKYMRQFFMICPIGATVLHQLNLLNRKEFLKVHHPLSVKRTSF